MLSWFFGISRAANRKVSWRTGMIEIVRRKGENRIMWESFGRLNICEIKIIRGRICTLSRIALKAKFRRNSFGKIRRTSNQGKRLLLKPIPVNWLATAKDGGSSSEVSLRILRKPELSFTGKLMKSSERIRVLMELGWTGNGPREESQSPLN